jgi:dUTP pyrophosphatase
MIIRFEKTREVKTPTQGTPGSAGLDFYVPDHEIFIIYPGRQVNIPSGIKVELPQGKHLVAFNKSSKAIEGLDVGATVVDSDYRGEIHLNVWNRSGQTYFAQPGEKLVQFLLLDAPQVELIEATVENNTERGAGGFGSTGK